MTPEKNNLIYAIDTTQKHIDRLKDEIEAARKRIARLERDLTVCIRLNERYRDELEEMK